MQDVIMLPNWNSNLVTESDTTPAMSLPQMQDPTASTHKHIARRHCTQRRKAGVKSASTSMQIVDKPAIRIAQSNMNVAARD
jgi:hypothetical protein